MKQVSIPNQFHKQIQQFMMLASRSDLEANSKIINLLEDLISQIDPRKYPDFRATILFELALAILNQSKGRANDSNRAISYLEEAKSIRQASGDSEELALIETQLGKARLETFGEQKEQILLAIRSLQKAHNIYSTKRPSKDSAVVSNYLGTANMQLSYFLGAQFIKDAISAYQYSLGILSANQYPAEFAIVNNNLGNAWLELSSYQNDQYDCITKAIYHYGLARKSTSRNKSPIGYANICNNLASANISLLDFDQVEFSKAFSEAQSLLDESLEILRIYKNPEYYGAVMLNKGRLLLAHDDEEDRKKAISCLREALTIFTEQNNPKDYIRTVINLGVAHLGSLELTKIEDQSYLTESIIYLNKALEVCGDSYLDYKAIAHYVLGDIYIKLSEFNGQESLTYAFKEYSETLKLAKDYPHQQWAVGAVTGIADTILRNVMFFVVASPNIFREEDPAEITTLLNDMLNDLHDIDNFGLLLALKKLFLGLNQEIDLAVHGGFLSQTIYDSSSIQLATSVLSFIDKTDISKNHRNILAKLNFRLRRVIEKIILSISTSSGPKL